jgi:hypothetical protein
VSRFGTSFVIQAPICFDSVRRGHCPENGAAEKTRVCNCEQFLQVRVWRLSGNVKGFFGIAADFG